MFASRCLRRTAWRNIRAIASPRFARRVVGLSTRCHDATATAKAEIGLKTWNQLIEEIDDPAVLKFMDKLNAEYTLWLDPIKHKVDVKNSILKTELCAGKVF